MAIRVASVASAALVAAVLAARRALDTRTATHLALRACRPSVLPHMRTCTPFGLRRRRLRARIAEGGAHRQMASIARRRATALRCSQRCRTPSRSRCAAQCGLKPSMPCGTAAHGARQTEHVIELQRRAATPGVVTPHRRLKQTITGGLTWSDVSTGGVKAACPATEQMGRFRSFRSFRSFRRFGRTFFSIWVVPRRCPNATSLSQVRGCASSTASKVHPSASGSHQRAAVSRAASESAKSARQFLQFLQFPSEPQSNNNSTVSADSAVSAVSLRAPVRQQLGSFGRFGSFCSFLASPSPMTARQFRQIRQFLQFLSALWDQRQSSFLSFADSQFSSFPCSELYSHVDFGGEQFLQFRSFHLEQFL